LALDLLERTEKAADRTIRMALPNQRSVRLKAEWNELVAILTAAQKKLRTRKQSSQFSLLTSQFLS
jgi:hypothetical protein